MGAALLLYAGVSIFFYALNGPPPPDGYTHDDVCAVARLVMSRACPRDDIPLTSEWKRVIIIFTRSFACRLNDSFARGIRKVGRQSFG